MSWTVFPLSPPAKSLLPSARVTLELGKPSPLRPKPSKRTEDVRILPWPPSAIARTVTERAKCLQRAAAPQWWAARAARGTRLSLDAPVLGGLSSSAIAGWHARGTWTRVPWCNIYFLLSLSFLAS